MAGYTWGGLDANGNPQGYLNGKKSIDYNAIVNEGNASPEAANITYVGSALPTVFGNLVNTFGYKNFSLSVNISYKLGYYFRRPALNYNTLLNGSIGNDQYAQRWQKPGDENSTDVPSFIYPNSTGRDNFYTLSAVNILKGDHVRLQYINLSYGLGRQLLDKWRLKTFQFYANAADLGILWRANKQGLDPEYANAIPPLKSFTIGLRAGF